MVDPLHALAGLMVGVLVGLTGVGGGSLMTPVLILLFGVQPVAAVGTDLLFAAGTKLVGAAVHARRGTVDWQVTGRLAMGSVPALALTLAVLALTGAHAGAVSAAITPVLGAALVLTAVALLFQGRLLRVLARGGDGLGGRRWACWSVLAGAGLGVLVSLTSVGAGALGVTVLSLLYPALPANRVVGSDIAHAVPLTLVAGLGYWVLGSVDVSLLVSLLSGSVPGIVVGSLLAAHVPARALRVTLAGVVGVVGLRLLA